MTGDVKTSPTITLPRRARALARERDRQSDKAIKAATAAHAAAQELTRLHSETCQRFGRDVPMDPELLDVLGQIDVVAGDRWLWLGSHNNHGVPVVRLRSPGKYHESSAARYLALAFDVIQPGEHGVLYPRDGDRDDINPWHRRLRRTPTSLGNPHRYDVVNEQRRRKSA
jgi:hypothetical protein